MITFLTAWFARGHWGDAWWLVKEVLFIWGDLACPFLLVACHEFCARQREVFSSAGDWTKASHIKASQVPINQTPSYIEVNFCPRTLEPSSKLLWTPSLPIPPPTPSVPSLHGHPTKSSKHSVRYETRALRRYSRARVPVHVSPPGRGPPLWNTLAPSLRKGNYWISWLYPIVIWGSRH